MSEKPGNSKYPSFDYRADGSWRISPPELQAEFTAHLAKLGLRPAQLTPQRLKELFEALMSGRGFDKAAETEQIFRDHDYPR